MNGLEGGHLSVEHLVPRETLSP